jgi:myo-inositol-1(or 4)-monophosphatase
MHNHQLCTLAEDAARAAGDHALSLLGHAQIEYKPGNHIVTQADRQCQEIITDMIGQRYPHHGFIGEEGPNGQLFKQSPTQGESIWWIIDPIDGTRNFAYGVPQFCVSIAAMKGGIPIVGVLYDPNSKMLFSTQTGAASLCNGSPMRCGKGPLNGQTQIGFTSRTPKDYAQANERLGKQCIGMYLGSIALHLAYVALGAYGGTFNWEVSLWDIAAGALIAENAGARVTHFDSAPIFPIDCETYNGQHIPLVVGGPDVHAHLLKTFSPDNDR